MGTGEVGMAMTPAEAAGHIARRQAVRKFFAI